MGVDSKQIARIKHALSTRHEAHKAELLGLNNQLTLLDRQIAEVRRPASAGPQSELSALGSRADWARRREKELLGKRLRLLGDIEQAKGRAAGSFSQCEAIDWIARQTEEAEKKAADRRQEWLSMGAVASSQLDDDR